MSFGGVIIFGINYLKEHFSHNQRYIIVAVFSMFLPFYMCGAVLIFLTIRLLLKGEIQEAYRQTQNSRYIIYFSILTAIISLLYQNYYGFACSIGILAILSFVLYYRIHITSELFDFITNCIIVLSLFAALYGLIEYIGILNSFDIDRLEIIIFNRPQDRINSVFFNANYYAMMIEFFVCITFYKILQLKDFKTNIKRFLYYFSAIAVNLFMLVLTACRTAWPALGIAIIAMLFLSRHYKTCSCIFGGFICACLYFLFNPSQFPRVDNIIGYFFVRTDIWKVAVANIKTHPLFGEGPMTYMHIYPKYNGHPTEHAHSVYLDPLLCFGIIGILTILPYIISCIKRIYHLCKKEIDLELFALIVSFILVVLIHGLLDYTIFFVQTGFLFLLVTSSFDIYKKELK